MSVLLDTGVLHGHLNSRDAQHGPSARIVAHALSGRLGRVVTTTFVVDEAVTLARTRKRPYTTAETILAMVGAADEAGLPAFAELLDVQAVDLAQIGALQKRHWDRGLSFTDCASLHVMERDGIDAIATFDKGFEGLVPVVSDA